MEARMTDAERLFAKARLASEVAKVAFGAGGRSVAYAVKERALAAMVRLIPFLAFMKSDRATNRYRLFSPFGEIHYFRFDV